VNSRQLQERLLLRSRAGGDSLVLDDDVLLAALDGSRALDAAQLKAMQQSPLTLRRLRHLSLRARRAAELGWQGSQGLLRAAASPGEVAALLTEDGCWSLHFVAADGGWRVILKLEEAAPFAARLLQRRAMLQVTDGGGAIVLQGRLDADGECERGWPFAAPPLDHLQVHGARFAVALLEP